MIDVSPQRQKELFLSPVYFSSDSERGAYNFYVRARVRWMTETNEGIDELISSTPTQSIAGILTSLIANPTERLAKGLAFTYNFMCEVNAHTFIRHHFQSVWGNRETPEYVPPWEESFTRFYMGIDREVQKEMCE